MRTRSNGAVWTMVMMVLGVLVSSGAETGKPRPNIVIILADDLGYGDLGCYGATKIQTPHLDRLAREGMRFTDAHSPAAVCSPSRYGLLMGEYPFRNPMFARGVLGPYHPLGIDPKRTNIASLLKRNGYSTGAFGKWHLGLGEDPVTDYNRPVKPGPLEIGFGECFIGPSDSFYLEGHRVIDFDPEGPFSWEETAAAKGVKDFRVGVTKQFFLMRGGGKALAASKPECDQRFTRKAVEFIERHAAGPFLLYLATNAVHVPVIVDPLYQGKSQCGPYGDYVMELDARVGEVLAALDRLGIADNTFVFFSSDNGGTYESRPNQDAFAHGHRLNGRLLGQKTDIWEAGHRVPWIVRWPGLVKPGTQSDVLVSLLDVMATLAEMLQIALPDQAGPDSYSFLHALTGSPSMYPRRESLVYQGSSFGRDADAAMLGLREGNWVYLPGQGSDGISLPSEAEKNRWEARGLGFSRLGFVHSDYTPEGRLRAGAPPAQLYDLSTDLGQSTNVHRANPERVAQMAMALEKIVRGRRTRP